MHPLITEKEIEFYKKEKYLGLIIEELGLDTLQLEKMIHS